MSACVSSGAVCDSSVLRHQHVHSLVSLDAPSLFFLFFFFLMIGRPPRFTLFPSPTLFRSPPSDDPPARHSSGAQEPVAGGVGRRRSEEHTSELQSHLNLVCRLLLEKKQQSNYSSRPRWTHLCLSQP